MGDTTKPFSSREIAHALDIHAFRLDSLVTRRLIATVLDLSVTADEARAAAVAAERARIVAFIRAHDGWWATPEALAASLERGEHADGAKEGT